MSNEIARALLGGVLIGGAGILLLLTNGTIAGISNITGRVLRSGPKANAWRYAFLGGLIAGGLAARMIGWPVFYPVLGRSAGTLLTAGLLVGFGTQVGSGCTSGHGVCGIGRFSRRSIIATLTFMGAGAVTVFVVNHLLGGLL